MISLDSTSITTNSPSTNPPSTNQTNNIIIFECSDVRRDTGLILLKQKKDPLNKFELHLYNDYINQAIAIVLDIKDLAKMFESLEDYFIKVQIESIE